MRIYSSTTALLSKWGTAKEWVWGRVLQMKCWRVDVDAAALAMFLP